MNLRKLVLPFALAGAVACAIGASSPSGTTLADLPGDAKLYTAEQIAALFSSLDATNAIEAMQAILSTNAVLRAELMEMHGRDCLRATNSVVADGALVIDPYGEQEAFVWSADSLDNMLTRMGLLENAAQGDCGYENQYVWPSALWFARSMSDATGTYFESPSEMVGKVASSSDWIYYVTDGDSIGVPGPSTRALRNLVGAVLGAGITNSAQIGLSFDSDAFESVVGRVSALESAVEQIEPCGCDLGQFVATLQDIADNLSTAVSGLNADYSALEARISALETAIGNLSPADVSRSTGLPVETVTSILGDARQDAADAADACAEVEESVEDFVAAAEAVEDLVESVIEYIGDI